MKAHDISAVRSQLGWSHEEFARNFGVPLREVIAWEQGRRIPRRYTDLIRHYVDLAERETALERAGLPRCPPADQWDRTPFPEDNDELLVFIKQIEDHESVCQRCVARQAYVAKHFPEPAPVPDTLGPFFRFVIATVDAVQRLPGPLRNSAIGGSLASGMLIPYLGSDVRAAFRSSAAAWQLAQTMSAALLAGAVGGFVYSIVTRAFAGMGRARPYLAGGVSGGAGFLVFALAEPHPDAGELLTTPGGGVMLAIAVLITALAVGQYHASSAR